MTMHALGAFAICVGWALIYAILVFCLIRFVIWAAGRLGAGGPGPQITQALDLIPIIVFVIGVIGCLIGLPYPAPYLFRK
jgi:hypothetical protein